ncbi:MAG: hypothetical protein EZS28_054470, partial [Streblomastix strix]
MIMKIQK